MRHDSFMNENSVFLFITKFPNDLTDQTHGHHGYHPANIALVKIPPLTSNNVFFKSYAT